MTGTISTGIDTLDRMLNGGLPETRSYLLIGGPGTGKSTVAMQYLQEGIENGETCFYITTEQTREELEDTFRGFDFDIDHDNLVILTVHMEEDTTLEAVEDVPTLKTLEGDNAISEGTSVPFNIEYITKYIRMHGDPDRIVFDSVSGLVPIADDPASFRHAILRLIRSFSDEFGATSIVTAEEGLGGGLSVFTQSLPFNVHGVIRLWRESRRGEDHHLIKIEKMRGVDHSKRQYEIEFAPSGVRVLPRQFSPPTQVSSDSTVSTGIPGLDTLLGGGLIPGELNLLLHDGRAPITSLTHKTLLSLRERGYPAIYGPPSALDYDDLLQALGHLDADLDELLDRNELTIFNTAGKETRWPDHENIVHPSQGLADTVTNLFQKHGEKAVFNLGHIDPAIRQLSPEETRNQWETLQANTSNADTNFLYVLNRNTAPEQLVEYFIDQSRQVMDTTIGDTGLQYISVEKSIGGQTGSERVVEHREKPPYIYIPD